MEKNWKVFDFLDNTKHDYEFIIEKCHFAFIFIKRCIFNTLFKIN
jgi:hypothetical protein